jgi:hypothetical protein
MLDFTRHAGGMVLRFKGLTKQSANTPLTYNAPKCALLYYFYTLSNARRFYSSYWGEGESCALMHG